MKSPRSHCLCGIAFAVLFAAAANSDAQVLLDDDFSHGNVQNPPSSSQWFMLANAGSGTPTLTFPNQSMVYTSIGQTTNLVTYFTPSGAPATLAVGQTMSLSMNFSMSNIASVTTGLRFGLFNSGGNRVSANSTISFSSEAFSQYDGYSVWFNPTGSDTYNIYDRTGSGNFAIFGTSVNTVLGDSNTATIGMVANTPITLSLSITQISATELSIVSSVNGVVLTRTDTSVDTFSFDTVALQLATLNPGSGQTATADNILVSIVPEPSVYALLGVGAFGMGMVWWRRRAGGVARQSGQAKRA